MIGAATTWVLVIHAVGIARQGVVVVGAEHKTEAQCREAVMSMPAEPYYWMCIEDPAARLLFKFEQRGR